MFGNILSNIIGIIAFIFVLGVIILIHEGGHFFFARRANILCREYSFGMGPLLVGKKKGETLYSIRAFPVGGFCAIAGEEVEEDPFKKVTQIKLDIVDGVIKGFYFYDDEKTSQYPTYNIISYDIYDQNDTGNLYMEAELDGVITRFAVDPQAMLYDRKVEMQIAPHNRTLNSKSLGQRAMVMFGGPLMNFVLAIIVFLIAGLCTTFPDYKSSTISSVTETGSVSNVLMANDTITGLKCGSYELEINEWNDISIFMKTVRDNKLSDKITITYVREGNTQTASVYPQYVINTLAVASDISTNEAIIGNMTSVQDSLIDNSKLQVGDKFIEINRVNISTWLDVLEVFENNINGDTMSVKIERSGEIIDVEVKPYSHETYELGLGSNSIIYGGNVNEINYTKVNLGITPEYKFNLGKSLLYTVEKTWDSFKLIFVTIGTLISSNEVGVNNLSGPVGIFSLTKAVANQGFLYVLNLIGMLSVNIGLMNLLPIPALDGGRLVFVAYEAITKKKPNQKVETALITVTMILLFGLMIFITFNDILRLFK